MRWSRSARWGVLMLVAGALHLPAGAASGTQAPGCSWPFLLDDDSLNAAFPDESSTYWMTRFVSAPQTRLVIRGVYPYARYFSFHAYDDAQRPVDSIADYEIDPDKGSVNPYRSGSGGGNRKYTVYVEFTAPPEKPAPNTVYAGAMENGAPNPGGFFIYRVYVSDDPEDPAGKVPLPTVTLEAGNGAVELPMEQCDPLPPSSDEPNRQMKQSNFPDEIPRAAPFPGTTDKPEFRRFYGPDREFWDRVPDSEAKKRAPRVNGGFLQNQQIAYLYTRISRNFGDVFVFRAKAPSFPDTRAGTPATAHREVRFWSICQNELATQRVTACLADYQASVGRDGYFTFVISDPSDRPANATRAAGVNWLPWGGAYYDGVVIYRHMLPARDFDEAIQNVEEGTPPAKIMGDYFPRAAYCPKETFEKSGWRACL